MPKRVPISPDVAAILGRATISGNLLTLPPGKLASDLYAAVDKVLRALGGRWNRKAGGHVFADAIGDRLAEALWGGFAVDAKRTAEQFFTPPDVARLVFERAQLARGMRVLEPSAGMGALLAEPLRLGCLISAVEQDEILGRGLRALLGGMRGCEVWIADFMAWLPIGTPVDRVLMNPPFGRGQDIAHVARAFGLLRPGGRLVAVMSSHFRFAENARASGFRDWLSSKPHEILDMAPGAFRSAGTGVATVIVTIEKEAAHG